MQALPQVRLKGLTVALLLWFAALSGCGDSRTGNFSPESGAHPAAWLPSLHAAKAAANLTSCADCHGPRFEGGVSGVSCASCHIGSESSVHPADWAGFAYSRHAPYARANGDSSCSNLYCHGSDLSGATGPSCTSCHIGGADSVHPVGWGQYAYAFHPLYIASNGSDSCSNVSCHGADLAGVAESGPSCKACHAWDAFSTHPPEWTDVEDHKDYVASKGTSSCAIFPCHGADLEGVFLSGPSCSTCH